METTTDKKPIATGSDIAAVLSTALQISRDNGLKEVCSEALLVAMLNNEAVAEEFLKCRFNVFLFKRRLTEKLKAKGMVNPRFEPPVSAAVEGLLVLNAMGEGGAKNNSVNLLKTIIKNNNTAAARLLKAERLFLNELNELVYKPNTYYHAN